MLRAAGATALGALSITTIQAGGAAAAPMYGAAAGTTRVTGMAIGDRRLNVVAGRRAIVDGRIAPAAAGSPVALQRRTGGRWRTLDRARTTPSGEFRLRYRARRSGSAAVRVLAAGARRNLGRLNVYRRALASWYGPGLYGGHLGCGGRLTPGTVGVAHRTLPCGTRVTLRHNGRTLRARVIDRGPYVGSREFDLTAATRARLGFSGTGIVLVAH